MTDVMQDVPKVFYAAALQQAVKFIRVNTPSQSPSEPEAAQRTLDLQMWVGLFCSNKMFGGAAFAFTSFFFTLLFSDAFYE